LQIVRSISLSDVLIPSAEITFLAQNGFSQFRNHSSRRSTARAQTTIRVAAESRSSLFDPATGAMELKETALRRALYSTVRHHGDVYFASDPYVASVFLIQSKQLAAPWLGRNDKHAGGSEPDRP